MTTQDSQSEIEDILGTFATYTDPCEFGFEDIIIKKIEDASHAIEAYVTTRVKEALEAIPIRQEEDEWDAVDIVDAVQQHIFTQLEALTTTTNGKLEAEL